MLGDSLSGEVEHWETVVAEPYESLEPCEEKEKTEPDEQELERECEEEAEIMETGDDDEERGGCGTAGNWLAMGVIQVGSRTSSAIIANSSSSSSPSS